MAETLLSDTDSNDEDTMRDGFRYQRAVLKLMKEEVSKSIHALERVSKKIDYQQQLSQTLSQKISGWAKDRCLSSTGSMVLVDGKWISFYHALTAR